MNLVSLIVCSVGCFVCLFVELFVFFKLTICVYELCMVSLLAQLPALFTVLLFLFGEEGGKGAMCLSFLSYVKLSLLPFTKA